MASSNSKFSFEEELQRLVESLNLVNEGLDKTNDKLETTKKSYEGTISALESILKTLNELQKGLNLEKVDGRKVRYIGNITDNLSRLIDVLKSGKGVEEAITTGFINTSIQGIIEAAEKLNDISKTDNSLKTFTNDMSDVNNQLTQFVGLAGTLGALNFDKLIKMLSYQSYVQKIETVQGNLIHDDDGYLVTTVSTADGESQERVKDFKGNPIKELSELHYGVQNTKKYGGKTAPNRFDQYDPNKITELGSAEDVDSGVWHDIYSYVISAAASLKENKISTKKDIDNMSDAIAWVLDHKEQSGGRSAIDDWLNDAGLSFDQPMLDILNSKDTIEGKRIKINSYLNSQLSQESARERKRQEKEANRNKRIVASEDEVNTRIAQKRAIQSDKATRLQNNIDEYTIRRNNELDPFMKEEYNRRLIKNQRDLELLNLGTEFGIDKINILNGRNITKDENGNTLIKEISEDKKAGLLNTKREQFEEAKKEIQNRYNTQLNNVKQRQNSELNKYGTKADRQEAVRSKKTEVKNKDITIEIEKLIKELDSIEDPIKRTEKQLEIAEKKRSIAQNNVNRARDNIRRKFEAGQISEKRFNELYTFEGLRDRRVKTGPAPGWTKGSLPAQLIEANKEVERLKAQLKTQKEDKKAKDEWKEKAAKAESNERKRREKQAARDAAAQNKAQEKAYEKRTADDIREQTTYSRHARSQFRKDAKLEDKKRILKQERERAQEAAWARLGGTSVFGISSQTIEDVGTILGIKKKNTLGELKAKRGVINADYESKLQKLNNQEIKAEEGIKNNQRLTPEKKVENIQKLREKVSSRRSGLLKSRETELSEVDNKIATISSQMGMFIGIAAIVAKIVKGIFDVANQSNATNNKIANALVKMGYTQGSGARHKVAIDQNLDTEWEKFKRNLGQGIIGEAVSGYKAAGEWILSLVNGAFEANKKVAGDSGLSTEALSSTSEGYLKRIIRDLEDGVKIDGETIKISAEESSIALQKVYNAAKRTSLSVASSGYMAGALSDIALKIKNTNITEDYGTIMENLASTMTGGNAATAYGINLSDNQLTGYVAKMHELDMANVEYTEAMKEHWRVEYMQHIMSMTSQKDRDTAMKQYEQLGDVMNTMSGQLYDFQEVQGAIAKDFTIPEVAEGNRLLNTGNKTNNMLGNQNDLLIKTSQGVMNLKDAYTYLNGDLSKIVLVYDDLTGKYELITSDYLDTLTAEEKAHITIVDKGITALAIYADMLGISDKKMQDIAEDAGLSTKQISELSAALENIPDGSFHIDDNIDEVIEKLDRLNQKLTLSGYSQNIQDYVNNGYAFNDGSTIDDVSFLEFLNGSLNPFSVEDKKKVDTFWDFWEVGSGESANNSILSTKPSWALNADELNKIKEMALKHTNGLANGGISLNDHIAHISEGNKAEAIIPLESEAGINALSKAMIAAGAGASGINIESININNDVAIADDTPTWNRVAKKMADSIATIYRREGDMNYGVRI